MFFYCKIENLIGAILGSASHLAIKSYWFEKQLYSISVPNLDKFGIHDVYFQGLWYELLSAWEGSYQNFGKDVGVQ